MTVAAAGSVTSQLALTVSSTNDLGGPTTYPLNRRSTVTFTNGSGADKIENVVADTRTLTTGASENIDFAGGLTDSFGNAVTFDKIKYLRVEAAAANTTVLTFGGTPTPDNPAPIFSDKTDSIALAAGESFEIVKPGAAGIAIGAGATDLLLVTNAAGASASYNIIVAGEVA